MGVLTRVIDGDSYEVRVGREVIKVRLYGIDAPESDQPFGREATEFVMQFLHSPVLLEDKGKDRYQRTLAELYIDGRRLSLTLVSQGLAHHFVKYSDDITLAKAEAQARKKRVGLWTQSNPIPPWDWRKGNRNSTGIFPFHPENTSSTAPSGQVFICDSKGGTKYHTQRTCGALQQCKSEIVRVTVQEAMRRGKDLCGRCGG